MFAVEKRYLDRDRLKKSSKRGIPHEMAAFKQEEDESLEGETFTHIFHFTHAGVFMQSLPKLRNISRKLLLPLVVEPLPG